MYSVPGTRGNKIAMLSVCFVLFTGPFAQSQCIATSALSPTTSSSVSFSGSDYSFNSPLNTLLNDGNNAVAASILQLSNKQTEYLQVQGFGFNIPTAATVCGIEVNVVKSADNVLLNLATVTDHRVHVMKNGTLTPSNLVNGAQWSSSDVNVTYGGTNEVWGTSWTPADINSGNFGFSISAEIHGTIALFPAARINYISMTVYYLDPGVLSDQTLQFHVANGTDHSAVLSWKSNVTDETATLSIERSANKMKWEPMQGPPQKNSSPALYTFTDSKPLPGKSFYRLKMISNTGEVRYSMIQLFELIDITSLKCYPNPFTTIIQVAGVIPGERVVLADIYGQQVFQSPPALNNTIKIDVAHLQPGIYVISTGNRKMKVQKN